MKETSCEVIRDLLPLYQDGVASEESRILIREHLKDCPACREEFARLSVPVSFPPEEGKDKEIRERLQQSVKKCKRHKRIKIAVLLFLLAAAAASCFWYTRPQRWTDVAGPWDFTRINAELTLSDGSSVSKEWRLELESGGDFDLAMDKFRTALDGGREYRAPLSSIPHNIFFPDGTTITRNPKGTVMLHLERADAWVHITAFGNTEGTVHIEIREKATGKSTGRICYHAGEALFDVLSQLVRDYGTPDTK